MHNDTKTTFATLAVFIMFITGCQSTAAGREVTVLTTDQRFGADCEFVGLEGHRKLALYTLKPEALQVARTEAADFGANAVRVISREDSVGHTVLAEALRCDPATWKRNGKRADPIDADALEVGMKRDDVAAAMGGGPVRVTRYGEADDLGKKKVIWIYERWPDGGRSSAPAEALWIYLGDDSRVVK